MALSTGLRPRSAGELEDMAQALAAGRLPSGDAWAQAQAWVAGGPGPAPDCLGRIGVGTIGPLVSILICTYRRLELLKQAVGSARAQSWRHEIIVVDDGSGDGTAEWLRQQPDLKAVLLTRNGGKSAALASGLARVAGEAVLILDDDDRLLPRALCVLAPALFARGLVGVFGDAVRFGNRVEYVSSPRLPPRVVRRSVLAQVPGLTGALLARTDAMRALGFDRRLSRGEDMDFFLRLSRVGEVDQVPLVTLLVRSWEGLRGQEGQRWSRTDPSLKARTQAIIQPVFRERWQNLGGQDRAEGHAWALGLLERGLPEDAARELGRWQGPHSESEVWIRERAGLTGKALNMGRLLVVDDGDMGALADTLDRQRSGPALHVSLEVPQAPETQLWWGGRYRVRAALQDFSGRWIPRLASSPEWAPPPSELPKLPLPAGDGLILTAVVRGWPLPSLARRSIALGVEARLAVGWAREGRRRERMMLLARLLARLPHWEELQALAEKELREAG